MNSSTSDQHRKESRGKYNFSVITISSSRFQKYGSVSRPDEAGDTSGAFLVDYLQEHGIHVTGYMLTDDNSSDIIKAVELAMDSGADVIITTGGTGLSPRDLTIESLKPMFEKEMPGFGELFRIRSFDSAGTAVVLTRTTAGIIQGRAVFCLPGSTDACRLGIEIIVPEAGHIIKHSRIN